MFSYVRRVGYVSSAPAEVTNSLGTCQRPSECVVWPAAYLKTMDSSSWSIWRVRAGSHALLRGPVRTPLLAW